MPSITSTNFNQAYCSTAVPDIVISADALSGTIVLSPDYGFDTSIISGTNDIRTMQDCIDDLNSKVEALSKKAIPRFHCVYCGTQNFEYNGVATTPQCPNCGALMRKSDEPEPEPKIMSHYNDF